MDLNACVWTKCHSNLLKIVNIVKFLKALFLQNAFGGCFRNVKETNNAIYFLYFH